MNLLREATALLLPDACPGCGRARSAPLCPSCFLALCGPVRRVAPAAGGVRVHAAADYDGPVRELLIAHKERRALALARPLGGALALAVRAGPGGAADAGPCLLVPVPSARAAVRARGHDPVRRMAVAAAAALRARGRPVAVAAALHHARRVADQSELGAAERRRNVDGAFAVRGARGARVLPPGAPVVLVDDLVTTGATLREAARAVAAGGGKVLAAAVVAAVPERSGAGGPSGSGAVGYHADGQPPSPEREIHRIGV
ncbi:hypothetical protein BIV57_10210 [Mangrovactinospora gilvigrisea]|uniref:Phosphoribosyltransferase domain-containing protein n=1 Tax=Mangrovactinospora gilvigrisea TaxID=1428644 RepID=A0A1J7BVS5_9ACTN|nr:phosphoribosyltransferase family protein [Mangrovactinospora gilvigrisea]OIV37569.1 hypothetical protein BIV57_10210 [Mangrovactinospora gilvigrisea]